MGTVENIVNLLEETRKDRLTEIAGLNQHFTLDQLRRIREHIDDCYNEAIWAVWRKMNATNEFLETLKNNGQK